MEIGKTYKVTGSNIAGYNRGGTIIGKVLAEFDRYYLLQCKNYRECINKLTMNDLKIKEVS